MRQYEDLLIDALLDNGFTLDEALRLIALQERIEQKRREDERARQLSALYDGWNQRDHLN